MKVDLVLLTNKPAVDFNWPYGKIGFAKPTVGEIRNAIQELNTESDWVLFFDAEFELPNEAVLSPHISKPVDIWHTGLKTGVADLPRAMDYVDPTWMYNKNAPADVEHSSFRLSFKALLIKAHVLKQFVHVLEGFTSIEMAGIGLGYALLKSGAIMRYTPELLYKEVPSIQNELWYDEWVFARKFYTPKWHWWLLFNMNGFLKNIRLYNKTANIPSITLKPSIHSSDKKVNATYAPVSVLAPTLDRYEYLHAELEQLAKQDILPLEVLITDQTPEARRQAIDTAKYPQLSIKIFPQTESGQCIAWNKLLEEAQSEYVLFLGDDADDITPDFIARLLYTSQTLNADMVAANVIEAGITYKEKNQHYYLSDTFPITLIKRSVLLKTGFMDMFYNKNIRADHDLAMRCHLLGALMIFNPSATIYHHRAPVGGLRAHKARVVTNHMVKQSLSKFITPTTSELYLVKKYYSGLQLKSYVRIKFLNQLFVAGGVLRMVVKTVYFVFKSPGLYSKYRQNLRQATAAINESTAGNR